MNNTNIRIEDHETIFPISGYLTFDMEYYMEQNHITDYTIVSAEEYGKPIPPVRINPNIEFYDEDPYVFISNMNTDDLALLLEDIRTEKEPITKKHHEEELQRAREGLKRNYPEIYKATNW